MAIQWSGVSGRMQVGIDVRHDPVNTGTATINVYVDVWVRVVNWRYTDDQTAHLRGSRSRDWPYSLNEPSTATREYVIGTEIIANQGLSYGGGPTYTFAASVSGAYDGSAPALTINWALPGKVPTAPSVPGVSIGSITANKARVNISASSTNGAPVNGYQTLIGTSYGNADQVIASAIRNVTTSGSHDVTGLTRGTTYGYVVRARSSAGDSGWRFGTFTTSKTAPSAPRNLRQDPASPPGPSTVSLLWDAVADDGAAAVTGYRVERSTVANFSADTVAVNTGTTRALTVDGLAPGQTYYFRVRATNSVGTGSPSNTVTGETLSRNRVKVPGVGWTPVRVWLRIPGVGWRTVRLWKRPPGGSWTL